MVEWCLYSSCLRWWICQSARCHISVLQFLSLTSVKLHYPWNLHHSLFHSHKASCLISRPTDHILVLAKKQIHVVYKFILIFNLSLLLTRRPIQSFFVNGSSVLSRSHCTPPILALSNVICHVLNLTFVHLLVIYSFSLNYTLLCKLSYFIFKNRTAIFY